jgi:hypothetical protein
VRPDAAGAPRVDLERCEQRDDDGERKQDETEGSGEDDGQRGLRGGDGGWAPGRSSGLWCQQAPVGDVLVTRHSSSNAMLRRRIQKRSRPVADMVADYAVQEQTHASRCGVNHSTTCTAATWPSGR